MSKRYFSLFLLNLLVGVLYSSSAHAALPGWAMTGTINEIAQNISDSGASLPGLLAAMSYLAGVLFATMALFKTVDHVTNPNQTPIRVPIIRFLIGGALFSLPIIVEAVQVTINGGGGAGEFGVALGIIGTLSTGLSALQYLSFGNFSSLLNSVIFSTINLPSLVASVAYLLGLLITVSAIYKTRDHVDDPDRVPLKDAVIRYLTAGALLALPAIYHAIYNTLTAGGLGVAHLVMEGYVLFGFFSSTQTGGTSWLGGFGGECGFSTLAPGIIATLFGLSSTGVDVALCTALISASGLPMFLTFLSYMIGLVLGLWSIFKIRDHVINPTQTPLTDGLMKMIAAGVFFAMPVVTMAIAYSVTPSASAIWTLVSGNQTNSGFTNDAATQVLCAAGTTRSLDIAMSCFMGAVLGPGHIVLNFFCYCAGFIFIMVGASRLTKSAQEGARGPGGLGTVSTFIAGGLLISATTILQAFSTSFFNDNITATTASLTYTSGMSVTETEAAYRVINAVLKFMIIIGMISFVRGIFIIRDVSEGKQGSSTMAGMTHIIGGALAVNLGPVINAIQATLGITAFGVQFS